ncbi:MAG: oligosaccharide flippase family protein [Anaerolineae bacterium]
MLLKHGAVYLIARGIPGLVNFAALAIYTRMVPPDQYGQYALIMAAVTTANAAFFEWFRLGVARYFPADGIADRPRFLSTMAAGYVGLALLTVVVGGALLWLQPGGMRVSRSLCVLSVGLLWAQAGFELNSSLLAVGLAPLRFALLAVGKAVLTLLVTVVLVHMQWGAVGLVVGLLCGMVLPSLVVMGREWRVINPSLVDWALLHRVVAYSLPLSVSIALGVVILNTGRIMLQWFVGQEAVGHYAAAYDMTQQTITMLMMVVNLAAYPLVLHALEQQGTEAARRQLTQNVILLSGVAFPAAAGLAVLKGSIANVLLGAEFREAATIIPAVTLATLLQGLRAYYYDQAFQLGERTLTQAWTVLGAAIVNAALNLWWIPRSGIQGAAWAAATSYGIALLMSALVGRHAFPLPFPWRDLAKVAGATVGMVLLIWPLRSLPGLVGLCVQGILGAMVYGLFAWAINIAGVRLRIAILWQRAWAGRSI